jgi:hypothetical protein
MNAFTKLINSVSSANYGAANQVFSRIMQQLVADRLSVEKTRIFTEAAEMTDAQMKKREEIVKSMKDKEADFKDRYGDRWQEVMYATATKMATEEGDTEYQAYFRDMLKTHGYVSPADIPADKKDDFFNAVDAGYSAKTEGWKK